MKRNTIIIALIITALLLTGCGSTKNTSENQEQSKNTVSETSEVSEETSVIDTIPLDIKVGDYFIIKEAKYNDHMYYLGSRSNEFQVAVKLKIQIISELDFNEIFMQTYSYNKDGERVGADYKSVGALESGLTVWTGYITTDCSLENFEAIGITSVRLGNLVGNVSSEVLTEQLSKTIKVTVDQMTAE